MMPSPKYFVQQATALFLITNKNFLKPIVIAQYQHAQKL